MKLKEVKAIKKTTIDKEPNGWVINWWENDEVLASDCCYKTKKDAIRQLKDEYGETLTESAKVEARWVQTSGPEDIGGYDLQTKAEKGWRSLGFTKKLPEKNTGKFKVYHISEWITVNLDDYDFSSKKLDEAKKDITAAHKLVQKHGDADMDYRDIVHLLISNGFDKDVAGKVASDYRSKLNEEQQNTWKDVGKYTDMVIKKAQSFGILKTVIKHGNTALDIFMLDIAREIPEIPKDIVHRVAKRAADKIPL